MGCVMHQAIVSISLSAGTKDNGEPKLRAIDDFSRSMINSATSASEKLRCDSLDEFFAVLRKTATSFQGKLSMFKADIDSAYRRVPVLAEHRKHAAIVFKTAEGTVMSEHYALPFGSVGSVYGWDRVGMSLHFGLYTVACVLQCTFVQVTCCEVWQDDC